MNNPRDMLDDKAFIDSICIEESQKQENHVRVQQNTFINQSKDLPSQYIKSDFNTIITTSHEVYTIDTSPDGQYIASAGGRVYSIQIWDPKSGLQVGESLTGHTKSVYAVKYSQRGDILVSCSADKTIRIWDIKFHKQIGQPLIGHASAVLSVSYTLDQKYIISCSFDKTIRLWNTKTRNEQIEKRIKHTQSICLMVISRVNKQVAYADAQNTIFIWDYNQHKKIGELIGHLKTIWSISYSNDGTLIVSSGEDLTIRVWDMMTRQQIGHNIVGHNNNRVVAVMFSPNMQLIISSGDDETVRIWNRSTGKQIGESLTHHKKSAWAVLFSLDGKYIITGWSDNKIMIMEHQYE